MVLIRMGGHYSQVSMQDEAQLPDSLELLVLLHREVENDLNHLRRTQKEIVEIDPGRQDPDLQAARTENTFVIMKRENYLKRISDEVFRRTGERIDNPRTTVGVRVADETQAAGSGMTGPQASPATHSPPPPSQHSACAAGGSSSGAPTMRNDEERSAGEPGSSRSTEQERQRHEQSETYQSCTSDGAKPPSHEQTQWL